MQAIRNLSANLRRIADSIESNHHSIALNQEVLAMEGKLMKMWYFKLSYKAIICFKKFINKITS